MFVEALVSYAAYYVVQFFLYLLALTGAWLFADRPESQE